MYAVSTSGTSFMSDSLMAWKPSTEEPSNGMPSSKASLRNSLAGTVKCCWTPMRSGETDGDVFHALLVDQRLGIGLGLDCSHWTAPFTWDGYEFQV